jgi:hypothetical protein
LIDRTRIRALLLVLAAVLAAPAGAQKILYKLVDRQGRVTYTDSVPKNFDGTVTPLDPVTESNVMPSAKPPEGATKATAPTATAPTGINETRRQAREDLDRKLRAAQAKAEAARKAKAEGADPAPEELQTIQHRSAPPRSGQPLPKPNCFLAKTPNGAPVVHCPSQVPNDAYYARQKKLDDDLAAAEEELTLAERAYRRGTD